MKAFYYHTTYFPVQYEEHNEAVNEQIKTLNAEPLAESLIENPEYAEHLALMGNDGWELANVQPLVRGLHNKHTATGSEIFFSVTAGYYLFWKKEYEKEAPAPIDEDRW